MSALTDVYQITYAGRDVLVGKEILTLRSAEGLGCGTCGHKLTTRWIEVPSSDVRYWLWCPECEERVQFVRRYYRAMRSSGKFLPARLAKSNRKLTASQMLEYNHRAEPFESVEAAEQALVADEENAERIDQLMAAYAAMKS